MSSITTPVSYTHLDVYKRQILTMWYANEQNGTILCLIFRFISL